jgi:hypothetical protein
VSPLSASPEPKGTPSPGYTLACPSYIIPGSYAENLRHLKSDPGLSSIGAMELLFFLYDDQTRELLDAEWPQLSAGRGELTFTLHMPDIAGPEHEELIARTAGEVSHYVLHPPEAGLREFRELVESWRARYGDRFLLENLIGRAHRQLWEETDWPLCMDAGHLLVRGESPARFFRSFRERIRQVHLHAVHREPADPQTPGTSERDSAGAATDHLPLDPSEPWLEQLHAELEDFHGIVELELFCEDHVLRSLEALRRLDARAQTGGV